MASRTLMCRDCETAFMFTEGEQEFYALKGLTPPTRCPACRAARKRQREGSGGRESYASSSSNSSQDLYSSSSGSSGSNGGTWQQREREMYDVICAECGMPTRVPFKPRGHRPVYCRDCYNLQR